MSKTLCVYCTRTHLTEALMKRISDELDAELLQITDGKDRQGTWGFVRAAIAGLSKKMPVLLPFSTVSPLPEYERILIGTPIWSETICPLTKSFLNEYGKDLKGQVSFVVTHMGKHDYLSEVQKLDRFLTVPHVNCLSVSTKAGGYEEQLATFVDSCR